MSKKLDKKKDLIITSILARITDFQLQSQDKELFDWVEELREYLCNFGGEDGK